MQLQLVITVILQAAAVVASMSEEAVVLVAQVVQVAVVLVVVGQMLSLLIWIHFLLYKTQALAEAEDLVVVYTQLQQVMAAQE
jgi:hypothetical protein